MVWDPGPGILNKPIPDPGSGSRGQKGTGSWIPDPGSRIRIRNTAFKVKFWELLIWKSAHMPHPALRRFFDTFEEGIR
jgi:hypothetical protein